MSKGGRPKSKHKMSDRLKASATEADAAAFLEACKSLRFPPALVLRELAAAFVAHAKEHKSFTFPARFSDVKKLED
jgi:hypothetical protein